MNMEKSSFIAPRIGIVGAGPAGLTAARILQQRGVAATVFEADPHADARDHGGTLDLHADGGRRAIRLAGLDEAFRARARFEDQGGRSVAHDTGAILVDRFPEDPEARPEIDRRELRDLLLASLEPGTVRWGKKLAAVETSAGVHQLAFADGTHEELDVVVGADGAWSRVRAALTDERPRYTGVTFFECWLDDVDARHPEVAALVGRGTMFAVHAGRGLVAQRNARSHVRVYVVLHVPRAWGAELLAGASIAAAKARLVEELTGFAPALLELITKSADHLVARPIDALPPTLAWEGKPGLTLIGDAAHLMPPVGIGVNLAMQDAAELALALASGAGWREAVGAHEAMMMSRARALAPEAAAGFAEMFGAAGASHVGDHLAGRT